MTSLCVWCVTGVLQIPILHLEMIFTGLSDIQLLVEERSAAKVL